MDVAASEFLDEKSLPGPREGPVRRSAAHQLPQRRELRRIRRPTGPHPLAATGGPLRRRWNPGRHGRDRHHRQRHRPRPADFAAARFRNDVRARHLDDSQPLARRVRQIFHSTDTRIQGQAKTAVTQNGPQRRYRAVIRLDGVIESDRRRGWDFRPSDPARNFGAELTGEILIPESQARAFEQAVTKRLSPAPVPPAMDRTQRWYTAKIRPEAPRPARIGWVRSSVSKGRDSGRPRRRGTLSAPALASRKHRDPRPGRLDFSDHRLMELRDLRDNHGLRIFQIPADPITRPTNSSSSIRPPPAQADMSCTNRRRLVMTRYPRAMVTSSTPAASATGGAGARMPSLPTRPAIGNRCSRAPARRRPRLWSGPGPDRRTSPAWRPWPARTPRHPGPSASSRGQTGPGPRPGRPRPGFGRRAPGGAPGLGPHPAGTTKHSRGGLRRQPGRRRGVGLGTQRYQGLGPDVAPDARGAGRPPAASRPYGSATGGGPRWSPRRRGCGPRREPFGTGRPASANWSSRPNGTGCKPCSIARAKTTATARTAARPGCAERRGAASDGGIRPEHAHRRRVGRRATRAERPGADPAARHRRRIRPRSRIVEDRAVDITLRFGEEFAVRGDGGISRTISWAADGSRGGHARRAMAEHDVRRETPDLVAGVGLGSAALRELPGADQIHDTARALVRSMIDNDYGASTAGARSTTAPSRRARAAARQRFQLDKQLQVALSVPRLRGARGRGLDTGFHEEFTFRGRRYRISVEQTLLGRDRPRIGKDREVVVDLQARGSRGASGSVARSWRIGADVGAGTRVETPFGTALELGDAGASVSGGRQVSETVDRRAKAYSRLRGARGEAFRPEYAVATASPSRKPSPGLSVAPGRGLRAGSSKVRASRRRQSSMRPTVLIRSPRTPVATAPPSGTWPVWSDARRGSVRPSSTTWRRTLIASISAPPGPPVCT